jgi:[ribosomal protein S18]-alanine N-acetyltransferase
MAGQCQRLDIDPYGVTLRACRHEDLQRVQLVERESFPDPYTESVFEFFLLDPRTDFVVACVGDSVVGYVIATRGPREGSIQSIAVLPDFRRRKVGGMLMKSAMEYLAPCARVVLLVGRTNAGAIRLYRSFSFRETGRVFEGYYPSGDDALEFEWKSSE